MAASIVFWFGVAMLGYVYFGYPLIVRRVASFAGKPVRKARITLPVTVVVTAYNEELHIPQKIRNILELTYPHDSLDVIVASDGSSDRTDELVRDYPASNVTLLRVEGRRGKTACQNEAVAMARGEIVVFTDATTRIEDGAIQAMMDNFADPDVGCVAGSLVYEAKGSGLTGQGGTAYWAYELDLRRAESSLGSLVGVSGCLYAVRRSIYQPIPPDLISDFVIAMRVREAGYRTVLEPSAICFEETLEQVRNELSMRVRVAVRSINALLKERRMLNVLRTGAFGWQLWSHKALRYASPYFWMMTLAANGALLESGPIYVAALVAQIAILASGGLGFLLHGRSERLGILRTPYYFVLTNLASFLATLRYLKGERMVTWKPLR